MKKGLIIVLGIITVIIIGIGIGVTVNKNKNYMPEKGASETDMYETNMSETGYFYRKPSSFEDITNIDIDYNNGKDYVQIVDNEVRYGGYDEHGNLKYENVREDEEFAKYIIKYIYKNNIKYLDKSSYPNNINWGLSVHVTGGGCAISGNDEKPEWFKKLLKKLEVDKYKGYPKENNKVNILVIVSSLVIYLQVRKNKKIIKET